MGACGLDVQGPCPPNGQWSTLQKAAGAGLITAAGCTAQPPATNPTRQYLPVRDIRQVHHKKKTGIILVSDTQTISNIPSPTGNLCFLAASPVAIERRTQTRIRRECPWTRLLQLLRVPGSVDHAWEELGASCFCLGFNVAGKDPLSVSVCLSSFCVWIPKCIHFLKTDSLRRPLFRCSDLHTTTQTKSSTKHPESSGHVLARVSLPSELTPSCAHQAKAQSSPGHDRFGSRQSIPHTRLCA